MKTTRARKAALFAAALGAGLACAGGALAQQAPTFEQVLAAPDDVRLNLEFAKAEAAAGNLLSASAAVERVLMSEPGNAEARLLYAALLLRLDDPQGAIDQLNSLDQNRLSPLQKNEASRYRRQAANRRNTVTWGGELQAGAIYEDDALGANILIYEFPPFPTPERSGTSATAGGRLGVSVKFNESGSWRLFGEVSGYAKDTPSDINFDFSRIEMTAGIGRRVANSSFGVSLISREYDSRDSSYLSEYGARIEGGWRVRPATTLNVGLEATSQHYIEPFIDFFAPGGHDGDKLDLSVSMNQRMGHGRNLTLLAAYEAKHAEYAPFSYDAVRLQAAYSQPLVKGSYLNLSALVRNVDYDRADPIFLGNIKREEERYRVRAALGAPLSFFSAEGATGDVREDLTLEGAVTYESRQINGPLADYEGYGAEAKLIWRFGSDR